MAETWLDHSDLPTPSLTRASSNSSKAEEEEADRAGEILMRKVAQMNMSDGADEATDLNQSQKEALNIFSGEAQAIFVDEPESYYEDSKSSVLFVESGNHFDSKTGATQFLSSYHGDDIESELDNSESQILTWAPADGLMSSPGLISSPGFVSSPGFIPSPRLESSFGLTSSPMTANFAHEGIPSPSQPSLTTEKGAGHRRKALLIGIKYYRKIPNKRVVPLKGPHHDVREVQRLLQDVYGWSSDCFRVLKDNNGPKEDQPTLENIRREIKLFVEDARPGDQLFFYFSGHGGQVPDLDGDEEDGLDEVIVCSDGNFLVDDELHEIMVNPIPAGCQLTALLDCCSSGTSLDLQYDALQDGKSGSAKRGHLQARKKQSKGNVVLLSACRDSARAYEKPDVEDGLRVRGMLTKAFIDTLKTGRNSTYYQLLTSVRSLLKRKDTMQDPQLSSSRMLDLNEHFNL